MWVYLARKVVGVGGGGTRAWVVLLIGRDQGDPLFLQFQEAETSFPEPYADQNERDHAAFAVESGALGARAGV
jgi:hypothetical protein